MTRELFIGLMSGTSVDGVDCSIVAFEDNRVEVISTHLEECPKELKENSAKGGIADACFS